MNLIAAVSQAWGIGYKNELLFKIRDDLARFREITTGKVVVMGHNTFKSLPGAKPLPNRTNIVLTRQAMEIPGVIVCGSINLLEALLQNHNSDDVFIIGGEKIYTQLLNRCKQAYITKVDANPPADVFMPNLDEMPNWKLMGESSTKKQGELVYKYSIYTNCA